jgi:anaphase-promoting complex subunit 5
VLLRHEAKQENMSRYLTPSKVSLLALVQLYCEAPISGSFTIPLLSFILSEISSSSTENAIVQDAQDVPKPRLSAVDFDVEALQCEPGLPGRTLFDLFIKRLWEIDSLDALHVLFQSLDDLFQPLSLPAEGEDTLSSLQKKRQKITLSGTSPIGLFVRRARLEFTRLQFSDVLKLWTAFVAFRRPTLRILEKLGSREDSTLDIHGRALQELDLDAEALPGAEDDDAPSDHGRLQSMDGGMISANDIERILDFQSEKMQRGHKIICC